MPSPLSRRVFLQGSAIAAVTAAHNVQAQPAAVLAAPAGSPAQVAKDEAYWSKIGSHYDVSKDFINLENAYYGVMSRTVSDEFKRNIDKLNKDNSRLLRREFDRDGVDAIRALVAQHLGVARDEIALTRNATESLQNLISNYKGLEKGDTILYGDLDYDAMQYVMNDLAERRGATVGIIRIPEPATRQNVLDAYEQALQANQRVKLLLVTHITHRTGLVFPVKEIVDMAKRRGVDVIVDVAQSWGQIEFKLPDLKADFIGGNLHKWIGAPLGLGFIHIRKERLPAIGVHMGDRDYPATDIRSRVHSGTLNSAAIMTIPAALKFHNEIGSANKGARLRYLRDHWVAQLRKNAKLTILTPDVEGMVGAVTSFRINGKTSFEDNAAISRTLMDQYNILTVPRRGPSGGACVRVTPTFFSTTGDLDKLVQALNQLTA